METDGDLRDLVRAVRAASAPLPTSLWREFPREEDFLRQFEEPAAMGQRHVREGEARVAFQREIVLSLRSCGRISLLAEELLQEFEDILAHYRSCLTFFVPEPKETSPGARKSRDPG